MKPAVVVVALVAGVMCLGAQSSGDPLGLVSVRIGWGCIEVPASYRVVETPTELVDHSYGFITAPGRPRVDWSFGLSEAHPLCHEKCKTIWVRKEMIAGLPRQVGLLEDKGTKALFIVDQFISFRADLDTSEALSHLRDIASRYRRRDRPETCQLPEKP